MLELGLKSLIAYLVGTLLGSLILGRLKGVDIRRMGSGNAGATNALRTQGKVFGLSVLILDIVKGVLAVAWVPALSISSMGAVVRCSATLLAAPASACIQTKLAIAMS